MYPEARAGISRVKDPTKSYLNATNDTGTPMYMAPEQFNGTRVNEKARVLRCRPCHAWNYQLQLHT